MTAQVTQNERCMYWKCINDIVKSACQNSTATDEDNLWHYTSGTNLISIITSGELWATQISCLNDFMEVRLAANLLLKHFESRVAESTQEEILLTKIIPALKDPNTTIMGTFVFSLSSSENDLSQWRAYSGGEGGYSIGLNTKKLVTYCAADKCLLAPVIYDQSEHEIVIKKIYVATMEFFHRGIQSRPIEEHDEWTIDFLNAWSGIAGYVAALMKHSAFKAEREVRIVRNLRSDERERLQFRQKQSMMTRHLPLKIECGLPIEMIYVGPCRNKDVSKISVGDLLRSRGINPDGRVICSDIPYQAV